jgi:ATP-dependent DNA helicase DinG
MLSLEEKSLIAQCFAAVRAGVAGFNSRKAQQQMMTAIASALGNLCDKDAGNRRGGNLLVVESPTGTGKTIAALIPALVLAKALGKRLVYSSSTIALQDQLRTKDLLLLQRLLPFSFQFVVAKGRGRYVCPAKLYELSGEGKQQRIDLNSDDAGPDRTTDEQVDQLARVAALLKRSIWNGDRDHLSLTIADELWARIITERQSCGGRKCSYFADCPF